MKALVYTANEEVTYREEPVPEPRHDEVVVAIEAVGICGSDIHAYLGHDPRRVPPLILGHEAVGTITGGPTAGRRVVLNPLIACMTCNDCLSGRSNLCTERELIGMYRPGAFAERIAMPEQNLIDVPDDMEVAVAALTEPAATAVHALNLAERALHRPVSEARALVIGGGSVGLLAALSLADRGCPDVHLAETNRLRAETAAGTGACSVIDPTADDIPDSTYDLVVDAVGSRVTRTMASSVTCPGGVLMHIGLMDNDGGFDARRMTLQEITVIGTYTYTPADLRVTIEKLHCGALGDLEWVEQRELSDGSRAFDDLLHGRTAAPKIVLRP